MGKVRARVNELRNAAVAPVIADIVERNLHASSVIRDESASYRDQLHANELIGKYEKDFTKQVEVHGQSISVELQAASMEELKAMLTEIRRQKALSDGRGQADEPTALPALRGPTE